MIIAGFDGFLGCGIRLIQMERLCGGENKKSKSFPMIASQTRFICSSNTSTLWNNSDQRFSELMWSWSIWFRIMIYWAQFTNQMKQSGEYFDVITLLSPIYQFIAHFICSWLEYGVLEVQLFPFWGIFQVAMNYFSICHYYKN